jgi:hypothetical protein
MPGEQRGNTPFGRPHEQPLEGVKPQDSGGALSEESNFGQPRPAAFRAVDPDPVGCWLEYCRAYDRCRKWRSDLPELRSTRG